MKSILTLMSLLAGFALSGCYYAEKSVTKPVHAVGHGVEKTGHVLHRTGERIQANTE